ncbi:MAG: RtcB family protein [Planctomycetota bacterium]
MKHKQELASIWTCCDERWDDPVRKLIDTTRRLDDVKRVAVMPDVHLAHGFCVGTVLATRRLVYPSAVGSDIGCGMLALPFRAKAKRITPRVARQLLGLLPKLVPARHHRQAMLKLTPQRLRLGDHSLRQSLMSAGLKQLGTLGSGNHFLELQRDEGDDSLWLTIHSGSRGLGQAIYAHHIGQASGRSLRQAYLDTATEQGQRYLRDVRCARAYARLNRLTMAKATAFALNELAGVEPEWSRVIHTDHNHVRRETVDGQPCWVHRKGAAPAFENQLSMIPGSMGTASYHVIGRGHGPSMRSSSHGAGRRLDRGTARRSVGINQLKRMMQGVWFNETAASRLRDEAPSAYKNIDQIVAQQRGQIKVVRRLLPVLNYKVT